MMRVCGWTDPRVDAWEPAIRGIAHSFRMPWESDDMIQEGRLAALVAVRNNAAVIASIRGAMRKWVRRRVDLVRIPERDRRRHPEPVPLVPIEVVDLAGLPDRAAFTAKSALEDDILARMEAR